MEERAIKPHVDSSRQLSGLVAVTGWGALAPVAASRLRSRPAVAASCPRGSLGSASVGPYERKDSVAQKTMLVSDISGAEIPEGKGATIRITFHDARKGVRELDVTDAEAEELGGRQVARRGRRPTTTSN